MVNFKWFLLKIAYSFKEKYPDYGNDFSNFDVSPVVLYKYGGDSRVAER